MKGESTESLKCPAHQERERKKIDRKVECDRKNM